MINLKYSNAVMPDLIRHQEIFWNYWIPASAGMTKSGESGFSMKEG